MKAMKLCGVRFASLTNGYYVKGLLITEEYMKHRAITAEFSRHIV